MGDECACKWTEDEFGDWYTDCNESFDPDNHIDLKSKNILYCCFCGAPINLKKYEF